MGSIRSRETASILHADLDSFFASVEQRDNPELRGRPVIVGGGVVLAASYEAKAKGVRTPMPGRQALALCPQAIVVEPRMSAYSEASKRVFEVFADVTPIVEPISVDEAFLDVAGLRRHGRNPADIGADLRREVRERAGLPISVGISARKFVAKIASAVCKPDGLLLVEPGHEVAFLHPLKIERLWGVGAVTSTKLHEYGIATIGEMAQLGEQNLRGIVGPAAAHLFALSIGHDPRHVRVGVRRRSIGSQRALGRRQRSLDELRTILLGIVDRLGRRLRDADRVCRTVVLRLRFDDFTRATRSRTLATPTGSTVRLQALADELFAEARSLISDRGLTLIGLSFANLDDADAIQLAFPLDGEPPAELDFAADRVREKFGNAALIRGGEIRHRPRWEAPLLPQ